MDVPLNWLDRTIGYVSPATMVRRYQARMAAQLIMAHSKRSYDAASKNKRTNGWKVSGSSANAEIEIAGKILRDRSRDLVRNNAHAARAISVIATRTVGTGIIPSFSIKGEPEAESPLLEVWNDWAETPLIDADGMLDIYGMQNLIMREISESGEVLIRRRWRDSSSELPVPLQLQVLEPDFIDSTRNVAKTATGGFIKQGIEFDSRGKRIAYYLYKDHPGEILQISRGGIETIRVPAEDICHVYRMDRAGQIRGVPWGAPIIIKLRDFDDYQDATLLRQKIAACYTAFVTDSAPTGASGLAIGNENNNILPEKVSPGMIELLGPGQEVTFGNPPQAEGYEAFSKVSLRTVGIGYNIPYEALTGDLSNVNFSSGRMGWIDFHGHIEQWRWLMLIPGPLSKIYSWFQEAAVLKGIKGASSTIVEWTPPSREALDLNTETTATIKQVRGGTKSLSEAIRESGRDPKKVFKEIKKDYETLDKLGLVLDTDGRKMTSNGIIQSQSSDVSSSDEDAKNT